MEITREFLEEKNACEEGIEWYNRRGLTDHKDIINALVADNYYQWAAWLLERLMPDEQKIQYAIFVLEQVKNIFSSQDLDAMNTTQKCLQNYLQSGHAGADAAYASLSACAASQAMGFAKERTKCEIVGYALKIIG